MRSFRNLIEGAFFHSWQRTSMVIGGIVLALALPITILLTQQEQDIRQDASGYTCGTGYPQQSGTCPNGWDCQQVTQSNNPFYNRYQCVERNPAPGTLPGTKHPTATPATNGGQSGTTTSLTSAPTINNYTNVSCNSITIKWNAAQPSNSITKQRFAWRTNDGTTNWQNTIDVTANATSHTLSGLSANTEYFFQVGATGSNGQYKWSNIGSRKTSNSCGQTSSCAYVAGHAQSPPPGTTNCCANGTTMITANCTNSGGPYTVSVCVNNGDADSYRTGLEASCNQQQQGAPCTSNPQCTGACTASNNTCGTSNGTQSNCVYRSGPSTNGLKCVPAAAPNQKCGIDRCQNNATCQNNKCVTPTPSATVTPSPTRTPTVTPTKTPTATPTDGAGVGSDDTLITLDITLPGIGGNTITSGPGSTSNNESPVRTTRDVEVLLGDSTGANITTLATGDQDPASGTLTFDSTTYSYKGDVSLGDLETGNYQIFVRLDNTLYKAVSGYPLITKGQKTSITQTRLASGDIDRSETSADDMTLDDYTLFMACYREMEICTAEAKVRSDLDDNGTLDTIDLLLLQRTFANREGDSPL